MLHIRRSHLPYIATILLLPCTVDAGDTQDLADAVSKTVRVRGVVQSAENNPVPGVRISLLREEAQDDAEPLPSTMTDANGKFQLEIDRVELDHGARPSLLAIDKAQRIGWAAGYVWTRSFRREELADSVELEQPIKLLEVRDFSGTLVGERGEPLTGAVVRPVWFSRTSYAEVRDKQLAGFYVAGLSLSPELQQARTVRTDEQGRFTLAGVPTEGTIAAVVEADGYGAPRLMWGSTQKATLRLAPLGVIRGRIVTDADEMVMGRVRIRVNRQDEPGSREFTVHFSRLDTPQANGSIHFEAPPGKYMLSISLQDPPDWYADSPAHVEVVAGKESTVEIPLLRAAAVRGRVVGVHDGMGVEGVGLAIYHKGPDGSLRYVAAAQTDKDGYYTGYGRVGEVSLQVNEAPTGFLAAEGNARAVVMVGQANEPVSAPDIKLSPAASIDIQVVDEQGHPLRDAEIHTVAPHGAGGLSGHQTFRADQDGRVALEGVDAEDTLPIRIRTKDGISDGAVVVEPREVKQPVQITASARYAFRLHGTVLDGSGQIIPNATAALQWHCKLASRKSPHSGLVITLATYHTNADGEFDIGPFWPGDEYQLTISADGHESRQTSSVRGDAGKTHDYGRMVLRSVQGVVQGQIVDSAGRPVADARVFNSGDAPARLETRSDPQGRFRLQGLRTGPVAIIAEKSGRLFAGVRTETGKEDLLIQLNAVDDGKGQVANPPDKQQPSAAQRQSLARWMLERLHSVPAAQRADINFLILRYMARLDPDTALRWLDEFGEQRLRQDVLFSIAESRIDADPEESLALVAQTTGSFYRVYALADRIAASNREAALRLAEDLVFRARQEQPPNQVYCVAQAGRLLVELGQQQAGQRLLDEAFEAAERLGGTEREAFVRGFTAEQIAPFETERAFALIKPIQESRAIIRHTGNVAVAMCGRDLDRALELARGLEPRISMRIAYRLAREDLAKAEQVLRDIQGRGADRCRAEGLAWLAEAVHAERPHDAKRLIDESLAICLTLPRDFDAWSNYGCEAPVAAHTAVIANRIGYRDMPSVVARVLACRRPDSRARAEVQRLKAAVTMGKILAVADAPAARWLLEPIRARPDLLGGGGYATIDLQDWTMAWSLVEPAVAQQLFDEQVQRELEGDSGKLRQGVLTKTVEALAASPEQFVQTLARSDALWFPGEE